LLYSDGKKTEVGKPLVKGIKVTGKVVEQGKAKKITVIKYKHKIRYRRKKDIASISLKSKSTKSELENNQNIIYKSKRTPLWVRFNEKCFCQCC